ncbi:hypothetical protein [Herbiconiux liangxiaofengii]|uniref:hypothetical protein n=1 Tax=Herbiconiux liangxiaofengii TaxID=3342795 RepID=UPI0035BB549A
MEWAITAGRVVLQHIGWAFGAYIPVLLGFYAIVIGGQLVGEPETAFRTRRTLGFVAEMMTGALAPGLAVILVAALSDPSQVGAVFVVLPVTAVMVFLAVQLGGFIVFEPGLRLAAARRSRDWARTRLRSLRSRSRKPAWLTVAINVGVGTAIGLGATSAIGRVGGSIGIVALLLGLISSGLALAGLYGVFTWLAARDRTTLVLAWVLPSCLYVATFALAAELFLGRASAIGGGLLAIVAFSLISTFWQGKSRSRFFRNWTIRGAGARSAARSVLGTYRRSVNDVREVLEAQQEDKLSWVGRLAAARAAFRVSP